MGQHKKDKTPKNEGKIVFEFPKEFHGPDVYEVKRTFEDGMQDSINLFLYPHDQLVKVIEEADKIYAQRKAEDPTYDMI